MKIDTSSYSEVATNVTKIVCHSNRRPMTHKENISPKVSFKRGQNHTGQLVFIKYLRHIYIDKSKGLGQIFTNHDRL